ncbi:hypothetical protein [Chitinophaga arvensicola]|uniref:Uncharacterized protein n=1 Tax=Chitinophaga arvensicola TaxID=29529 RepID=A0A1I0SAD7_9BACT|nr:hypothetical protein [Chitinophaga arvensicola]SEW53393.1 hypothetical protein SAMN04488122_5442 [Chitinophaga arvensicola]
MKTNLFLILLLSLSIISVGQNNYQKKFTGQIEKKLSFGESFVYAGNADYNIDNLCEVETNKTMNLIAGNNNALILHNDSLYSSRELNFTEISKNEFLSCKNRYKTNCVLDSGQFISGSGIYVIHDCKEICETYLAERNTDRKMLMPSSYDAGILKMLLSSSCDQLLVCSSYDGPDYSNYYEHRAEIFLFNVSTGIGLKGITPALNYYTNEWSINNLIWVDENTIALELYNGTRTGNGENLKFRYFKSDLNAK